jgi:hypothetical protein
MINPEIKPCDNSAYTEAIAFESMEPKDGTYDFENNVYNGITHKDVERFARIVAYKVAKNIKNGYTMDPYADPLVYVDCEDYPCLGGFTDETC